MPDGFQGECMQECMQINEETYDNLFVNLPSVFDKLPFDMKRIISRFNIAPEIREMKNRKFAHSLSDNADPETETEKYHRRLCYATNCIPNDRFYRKATST
jgi:hypothetical protein